MIYELEEKSERPSDDYGSADFLISETQPVLPRSSSKRLPLLFSFAVNVILSALLFTSHAFNSRECTDPSLGIYSPVNGLVEYHTQNLTSAFMTKTPYMGFPTDEIDQMWEDLYQYGNSYITKEEASQLDNPTMPMIGTEDYIIELDVFHQIHCLNDIRKAFFPERFPGKWEYNEDGTVKRETMQFRHWDHCIDILRQSLMCHADVSPISWRLNVPVAQVLAPRLETTHTCRNFTKIQEWAREHEAKTLRQELTPEEINAILEDPPFDQSPWEDLSSFWKQFPGNKFFKEWRDADEQEAN